jgi:hypothetical protein
MTGRNDVETVRARNIAGKLKFNETPPPATGEILVDEWYTDLPWHQKLSTLDSNLIDVPFVLPFEALPKEYRDRKDCAADPARCMLRYGIVDVIGMHRTGTVYRHHKSG